MAEEASSEAYVSAEQSAASKTARVPASNGNQGGSSSAEEPEAKGTSPAVSLIYRARGRSAFDALGRSSFRVREGPLRVRFALEPPDTTDGATAAAVVAYAIGRQVGNAVKRNRLRRRLREAVRLLVRRKPELFLPGFYLIGADPAAARLELPELMATLERLLKQLFDKVGKP